MKKIGNFIEPLFFVFHRMLVMFPFGMALFFAVVYLDGGWADLLAGHGLEFYFLAELKHKILAAIFLILGMCVCLRIIKTLSVKDSCLWAGFWISVVALAARIPLIAIFEEDIQPFSDFKQVWDMAHGQLAGNIEHYSLFPAYLNFTAFVKWMIAMVGDKYKYVIYLNAALASFTACVVYFIAKRVTGQEKTALAAGLLYACMPSNIVYCMTGTPEFITVAFDALGALCLIDTIQYGGGEAQAFPYLVGWNIGRDWKCL